MRFRKINEGKKIIKRTHMALIYLSLIYLLVYLTYSIFFCFFFLLTIILPFTLEGDRWRVAGTFDTGTLQQELDRPSCKRSSLSLLFSLTHKTHTILSISLIFFSLFIRLLLSLLWICCIKNHTILNRYEMFVLFWFFWFFTFEYPFLCYPFEFFDLLYDFSSSFVLFSLGFFSIRFLHQLFKALQKNFLLAYMLLFFWLARIFLRMNFALELQAFWS